MRQVLEKWAIDGRVDMVTIPPKGVAWRLIKALSPKAFSHMSPQNRYIKPLLAIDPGETTGVAVWDPSKQAILLLQVNTKDIGHGFDALFGIINFLVSDRPSLAHVRYEDYRVYGHMTSQHAFNNLHTARVIGAIEVACHLAQVTCDNVLAIHAKTFWTDQKLKMAEVYNPGLKHARDAQRHLLRYMGEGNGA